MTSVGWLHDRPGYVGGAELTTTELAAAKPDGVELVECPVGHVARNCDLYVIHNSVTYSLEDYRTIPGDRPVYRYWNDVGSWLDERCRAWLDDYATPICISPLQAEYMGFDDAILIPPPVQLDRFYEAAERVNGGRAGAVSVGSWRNRGKGAHRVQAWAAEHQVEVEFVGGGPFAPQSSRQIAYQGMPSVLAAHETFVFLPEVIEPFGRCVAEAWAAGCEIVTNELVGAAYWIREAPDKLGTAAEDFWKVVLGEQAGAAGQVQAGDTRRGARAAWNRGASDGHGEYAAGAGVGVQQEAGADAADQVGEAAR